MADQSGTDVIDDDIAAQLFAYGDALELARGLAEQESVPVAGPVLAARTSPWRRGSIAFVAAAAAIVVVAGVWVLSRADGSAVITDPADPPITTVAPTTTAPSTDSAALQQLGSQPHLLPASEQWAVIRHWPVLGTDDGDHGGVWVWRLDGHLFILASPAALGGVGPVEDATIESLHNRSTIGWVADGEQLGLESFDVDETTLRSVAEALVRTDDGWSLPGAELVLAEPAGPMPTGSISEQIDLSPIGEQGTAEVGTTVTSTTRHATPGSLYRELFEASSLGTVTETAIAGQAAFLIVGPFASYALVGIDDWVINWQTTRPGVDLAGLLETTEAVTDAEWDQAISGADDVLAAAVDQVSVPLAEPTDARVLPRYVLPDPYAIEWVTDMGIWTPEQRAQRQALVEANIAQGPRGTTVRTQAFRTADTTSSLPIPEVTIDVYVFDDEAPPVGLENEPGFEVYTLGDLEGILYVNGGPDQFAQIHLSAGNTAVVIDARGWTATQIRDFADTLTPRSGDPADGFDTADRYEQLFDRDGPIDAFAGVLSRWTMAWTHPDAGPDAGPGVSVQARTFEEFQLTLMNSTLGGFTTLETIDGGRYIALTNDSEGLAGQGIIVDARATLLRYDATQEVLTTVSVHGDIPDAIDVMEALTEIDLETWTQLVTPFNADPLRPR